MENAYGVGITNRYSCFLDNDDDQNEFPELDKDAKKKEVPVPAAPAPTKPATQRGIRDSNVKSNVADSNRTNQRGSHHADRGSRGARQDRPSAGDRGARYSQQDREDRNNRRNRDDRQRDERNRGDDANRYGNDGTVDGGNRGESRRGGSAGGGYYRGSRGGAPGFRGDRGGRGAYGGQRKREYDRQSGSDKSGVKPVDKRDGAGSRNWGTYKDDETELAHGANEERQEEKVEGEEDRAEGQIAEIIPEDDGVLSDSREDPPKTMTLDEYKALQESQRKDKPVFNLRKAGEGEDQSQWKQMTLKEKKKQEDESDEEGEIEDDDEYNQRGGRHNKQVLEIDFHFADTRRGGPGLSRGAGRGRGAGFGDRGGRWNARGGAPFRGGRGRGGPYNNRDDRGNNRQTAPKVDDERDFPSLG